jgi:hypothetical protein
MSKIYGFRGGRAPQDSVTAVHNRIHKAMKKATHALDSMAVAYVDNQFRELKARGEDPRRYRLVQVSGPIGHGLTYELRIEKMEGKQ